MDSDRLSLIKNTLLGALGGSAITSLFLMQQAKEDAKAEKELEQGIGKNQIVVPLSRKHFMKALGLGKKEDKKSDTSASSKPADISSMSPAELNAYKASLLRKRAECQKARQKPVQKADSQERLPRLRREDGRYASSDSSQLDKKAGILSDAGGTLFDSLGAVGGAVVGASVVKKIADTIAINRKKKQVEQAKRRYAGMLRGEINDDDLPYYTSGGTKTAQDRGLVGRTLGYMTLAGVGSAGLAALVTYRILENRRKAAESAADKDLSKYPVNKTISFKFAEDGNRNRRFFVNRRRTVA